MKIAFALTINRDLGQSAQKCGILLPKNVWTHGQVYVAFSCCGNPHNIFVWAEQSHFKDCQGRLELGKKNIKNVVYKKSLVNELLPLFCCCVLLLFLFCCCYFSCCCLFCFCVIVLLLFQLFHCCFVLFCFVVVLMLICCCVGGGCWFIISLWLLCHVVVDSLLFLWLYVFFSQEHNSEQVSSSFMTVSNWYIMGYPNLDRTPSTCSCPN